LALTVGFAVATAGVAATPASAAIERVAASAHVQAQLLPAGPPATGAPPEEPRAIPLRVRNPAAYARARRASAGRAGTGPARAASASHGTAAAVFGSLSAPGASAAQQISAFGEGNDTTPPDTTGAIGPNDYVEMVNAEIIVYDRASLAQIGSPDDVASFTGGVSPCDVQIKYDPSSDRWFYVALRCDGTTSRNQLYVGWSKRSDPSDLTGGWCRFSVSSTPATVLDDYPKLGLDGGHIIIGANTFDATSGNFDTAHILVATKPPAGTLGNCAAPAFSVFGSAAAPLMTFASGVPQDAAFTPQPATISDRSGTTGYVVAADLDDANNDQTGSNLMLWHITGSGALVADGDVAVPSFAVPPAVTQPGSSDTIDPLDGRLTQAVAASDPGQGGSEAVWTQHTVSDGASGSVVAWYELVPGTMTLVQTGRITDGSGFAFNGAIAPTRNGGAVINYNTGGSTQDVDIEAQSRNPADTLGTMSTPITLATSGAVDSDFSCPSQPFGGGPNGSGLCRWGDYAGASVDPDNPDVAWGSSQVSGPTGTFIGGFGHQAQWQTQNFALTPAATPAPTATFTATPALVTPGQSVSFDATASSGSVTGYSWDFGDTQTGTGATPTHMYAAAGVFVVTLTVTDGTNTSSTTHVVTVDTPPVPAFTAAPNPAFPGAGVSFNGNTSSDPNPGGTIVAYSWDFGDGATGTGATPTHAFATPGVYTVRLTTTDDHGQAASTTGAVTVDRPVASFTVSSNPVTPGTTVAFNAGGSSDPVGAITGYSWNFGDGTSGTGIAPSHAYAAPGNYVVTLTVANSLGQAASANTNIIVNPPPTASFTISPNPATIGSPVSFDAGASTHPFGTVASYAWSFGDGGTATGVATTHSYALPGTYAVTLTVTDSDGQVGTTSASIVANPARLTAQLSMPGGQKLSGIRKGGLKVTLTTNQGVKATFKVTATIKPAKRGQKSTVVTLLSNKTLTVKSGTNRLVLKLNARQLNRLPSQRSIVFTVTATVTDAFSQTRTPPAAKVTLKS
jgi:PKD repeat protein